MLFIVSLRLHTVIMILAVTHFRPTDIKSEGFFVPITHHPVLGVGGPGAGGGDASEISVRENRAIPTIHFFGNRKNLGL